MPNKKPSYQDLEELVAKLKSENNRKQSEDRFNAILQASEDMITIHKPNGKYIYYNGPKCYAITAKDIVGKMPNDLFDKEVSSKLLSAFKRVEKTGISETFEVYLDWLGEKRWFSEYIYPIKNDEGKIVELVKVCRDIDQRKKIELKLKEQHKDIKRQAKELHLSKEKIQRTLELLERRRYSMDEASKIAKIGYWEHDIITNKVIWSDLVYNIFGKNPKDGIPLQEEIFEKFDNESRKKLEKVTIELLSKGTPYDVELEWTNTKGIVVWIRNVAQPIYNEQNKIVGKRGVMQNISDSKKAQHNLELSKHKLQNTLKQVKENEYSLKEAGRMAKIGYWMFDNFTENLFWSDALYQIYGADPKLGVPSVEAILSVYTKESRKLILEAVENIYNKGIPYDIELEFTNFKNEKRWIRNIGEPIYNDKNENIGRRGISQDITQKKRNEKNLDEQNKKLNELNIALNQAQKLSHVGSWQWNMKTDTAEWSDEMYNIYGVSKDSFYPSNENVSTMILPEDSYKKERGINTLMVDKMFVPFEFRIRRPSGEIRHLYIVALQKNSEESVFGVTKDITAQKLIEEEKKEYITRLNEAQKIANIGSWVINFEDQKSEWSDEMFQIWGFDKGNPAPEWEQIVSRVHADDIQLWYNVTELVQKEGIPYDIEFRICLPNNEQKYIRAICKPVFGENNKVTGLKGVNQDITKQKLIEEENLRIQGNYMRLFDNASVSIWNEDFSLVFDEIDELRKLDIPNITLYLEKRPEVLFSLLEKLKVNNVNKATLKLFKAKSSEEFLHNITETFAEGADKVFIKIIDAIWCNKKTFTSEVNYKTLEGDEFVAIISIAIPQTKKEQKTVPVNIQSIQNLKDAELDKRETLNRLKESQEIAKVGSWFFNIESLETKWSDETYRIWGFNKEKPAPNYNAILSRIHIDDRELFEKATALANDKGIPYDIEFRIFLLNNEQKTIRSICKPIFGKNGEVVSLKGTNQDITEQKRIRDEIEKAEEMYRLLSDNSNDLICLQESDSRFKYISPSIKSLLGYEQSDFLGRKVFSLVHEDDIDRLKDTMNKNVFSSLNSKPFTFRIRHKEGYFVWFEFLSSPVFKNNEINYFVTTARDITKSMLAKQEIQEYQTSLQKMTTEMTLIEEKQKKEIASNIHDHLSQSLVISKMKINELKKNPKLNIIHEDLIFVEKHISEVLENSRKITYELSPPVLYQLGILDALNWLLEDVEATHKIRCQITSNVSNIKLSDVKSILLYRSIQELIKNVVKYANATLITLEIDKIDKGVNLLLKDNGEGFNTSILNNYQNKFGSGFGLFAVQERIRNIKGEFTITSKINKGTSVNIFIPLL